jgi:hypothetical protein
MGHGGFDSLHPLQSSIPIRKVRQNYIYRQPKLIHELSQTGNKSEFPRSFQACLPLSFAHEIGLPKRVPLVLLDARYSETAKSVESALGHGKLRVRKAGSRCYAGSQNEDSLFWPDPSRRYRAVRVLLVSPLHTSPLLTEGGFWSFRAPGYRRLRAWKDGMPWVRTFPDCENCLNVQKNPLLKETL